MPVPVFPHGNHHVPTLAQLLPELSLGQLSEQHPLCFVLWGSGLGSASSAGRGIG